MGRLKAGLLLDYIDWLSFCQVVPFGGGGLTFCVGIVVGVERVDVLGTVGVGFWLHHLGQHWFITVRGGRNRFD